MPKLLVIPALTRLNTSTARGLALLLEGVLTGGPHTSRRNAREALAAQRRHRRAREEAFAALESSGTRNRRSDAARRPRRNA